MRSAAAEDHPREAAERGPGGRRGVAAAQHPQALPAPRQPAAARGPGRRQQAQVRHTLMSGYITGPLFY